MPAHIHAALMAEYAKDALETETPWERWELQCSDVSGWTPCIKHPTWRAIYNYRRKSAALCQVEGRDVFPGDKLWQRPLCKFVEIGETTNRAGWLKDVTLGCYYDPQFLSWTEPARTKTVYQWAFTDGYDWKCSRNFYADQQAAQSGVGFTDVRRLDYTALEVPA